MNKVIKKIAMDCDVYCDQHYPNSPHYDILWEQKFAELIVRECAKVIETNHPEFDCKESADNLIRRAGRMDAIDEIRKHFGVEL